MVHPVTKNACLSAIASLAVSMMLIHCAPLCHADECSPFQVSVAPDVQLVPKERTICGARLSLPWGDNAAVTGLDVGLVNAMESLKGIEIGGFNWLAGNDRKESWGIQLAGINYTGNSSFVGGQLGLVNVAASKTSISGVQAAVFNFEFFRPSAAELNGIQLGGGNFGMWNVSGLQLSLLNEAATVDGAQIALWGNGAEHVHGLQVGLINWCQSLRGVQIGLINIVADRYPDKGLFVSPLVNVGW